MKQTISVEIPDGFEVIEDQGERGYIGQGTIILKLRPTTEDTIIEEAKNITRINELFDGNNKR